MNTIRCAAPLRCVARRTAHTGPACTGLAPRRPAPLARVAQPATGSSSSSSAAARRTAVTAAAMATYEPASSDEALRVVQAQVRVFVAAAARTRRCITMCLLNCIIAEQRRGLDFRSFNAASCGTHTKV